MSPNQKSKRVPSPTNFDSHIPPYSQELESNVLGICMSYNEAQVKNAIGFLDADDFYIDSHRNLFLAIKELYNKGEDIDALIVIEKLKALNLLEAVGGHFFVMNIISGCSTYININTHIRILKQRSLQRKLIDLSHKNLAEAHDLTNDIFQVIDETMVALNTMSEIVAKSNTTISSVQAATLFLSEVNDEDTVEKYLWETGHQQFDDKVGYTLDKILLIAGGAKYGKSKFNMSMTFALLERHPDVSVYWVTLEDNSREIIASYIASKIFMKSKDIKRRAYTNESKRIISEHLDRFNSFDIVFQEQSAKSFKIGQDFQNFCKVRKGRLNILIVDNILSLADRDDFKGSENSMYDYVMGQMLNIRQKTKGCIVLIHHYKDSQQNEEKIKAAFRPRLTDLKGTESFRRVPNAVLLINNPGKHDDLMNEYDEDTREALRHLFIVDTGANRDDKSDDDNALIRYFHTLDYNIFIEI